MKRELDHQGHLAIVTGGAGGIGLEFAKILASKGCSLILADINEQGLDQAASKIRSAIGKQNGVEIFCLKIDLSSGDIVEKTENFCIKNSLEPDILINNAGIFSFKPITDTPEKKTELFIDLHVRAVTLLSQWFVKRRKEKGWGYLLNMSSMSCWMPMPGLAMYSSTKSYIRVFSRALHYEMRDYGVGVTVACPGGIATDLFGLPEKWKKFAVAIGVLDTPERFAKKAVNRMIKKKKQYINGLLNRFSIFFIGVMPTPVRMSVKRRLLDKGITR